MYICVLSVCCPVKHIIPIMTSLDSELLQNYDANITNLYVKKNTGSKERADKSDLCMELLRIGWKVRLFNYLCMDLSDLLKIFCILYLYIGSKVKYSCMSRI